MDKARTPTPESARPGKREKCLDKQVTRLLILHRVGLLFQESLEPTRIYHILLSASTAGEGLGFNRAILFLYDQREHVLRSELAIGQLTAEEAGAVWQHIEEEELSLDDFLSPPEDADFQYGTLNERIQGITVPVQSSQGVLSRTVLGRAPQRLVEENADFFLEPQLRQILGEGEIATYPLVHGDQLLGVVLVDNRFGRQRVEDEDLQMLGVVAAQAAVALTNARLYAEVEELNRQLQSKVLAAGQDLLILNRDLENRVAQLSALQRIVSAMTSVMEPDAVLELVVREAVGLMRSAGGAIHLLDPERGVLTAKTAYGIAAFPLPLGIIRLGEGLIGRVAEEAQPIRCPLPTKDPADPKLPCTMLGVPMLREGRAVGVLSVARDRTESYSDSDVEILSLLASHAVNVLEQAKVYADLDRQNREIRALYEELQRSNQQLRKTQAELIRKDRLAFLGEMSGIVAHEIRNPLTSIRGFAQRIARKGESDPELKENADIIVEEVDRLKRVLGDVLDFARRAKAQPQPTDLRQVIQETLQLLSYDPDRLEVKTELQDPLPLVYVDAEQMKQVLLNLFRNAVQAMNGEGTLTIRGHAEDKRVEIEVTDTGPGIPPEIVNKMFTPFFTTKPTGTGLGLSLVKSLVEDHRGEVSVHSQPGEGATFRVSLPRSPDEG
jgi:signal transduction histidine kinase